MVAMAGGVMLAQPLQDEFVVHETLDGLEQECVEGQVADLLQLKLFVHRLQLLQPLRGFLQLRQHLVVFLQEAGEFLMTIKHQERETQDVLLGRQTLEESGFSPLEHTCSSASHHQSSGSPLWRER